MKITNSVLRAAALTGGLAVGLVLPGSPAMAAPGDCADELNHVEEAISAGVFLGQRAATDRANLLATLEDSEAKVDAGKYDDAITKLLAISDKAVALATAAKPKLEDSTNISATVADAVSCLAEL